MATTYGQLGKVAGNTPTSLFLDDHTTEYPMRNISLIFALACLFINGTLHAQCQEGDCSNGQGTYRFSSGARYIGQFKDGKSNGGFRVDIDADGKITLAVAIDSTGKDDVYYTDVTMNDVGEVTGWKQYDKDSVFRMQGESVYDKHQMLSNTIKDSVGTVKNSSTSKYNDKGELIESSFTNVGKDSTTTKVTKYTYDAHDEMGNWTQRTTMEDGKPTKIVKRTYTYRKEEEKKQKLKFYLSYINAHHFIDGHLYQYLLSQFV